MILVLLSFISDYNTAFIEIILARIIPGINTVLAMPDIFGENKALQYVAIILLSLSTLWLSSSGFAQLVYSQNYIYNHEYLGNWFINRLKGLVIVIAITVYLFLGITIYLWFYKLFEINLNTEEAKKIFFYVSFTIYLFFFIFLGIGLLFKLTPSFKIPFNTIFSGVLVVTIPMVIFTSTFGYLTSLINYSKYGLFGTFMYIALFVFTFSYCLTLGVIVNEAYYKTYFSTYTISKKSWLFWKIKF